MGFRQCLPLQASRCTGLLFIDDSGDQVRCPTCGSLDVDLIEWLPDTRRSLVCLVCDHRWLHGEPKVVRTSTSTRESLKTRFPGADAVPADVAHRVATAKAAFLERRPTPRPEVAAFWRKYQGVFSEDGLWSCDPQDLKDFANTSTGARPGNMSVFNTRWNEMGEQAAAQLTRETISYLLYGPEDVPLEDRLTRLIRGGQDIGMPGFRESLLTKVLCIVHPNRFLPILRYTTDGGGKREIADAVLRLRMPHPDSVNWTIGRLAIWSNDVLLESLGDGFVDNEHAATFLWDQWTHVERQSVSPRSD